MDRRPTLLHSCARAATASEARFRVRYPNSAKRVSRVIGLDVGAAAVLSRLAAGPWNGARLLTYVSPRPPSAPRSRPLDAVLRALDGSDSLLGDELAGVDVAVMIATDEGAVEAASLVGEFCAARGIMTAGLVVAGLRGGEGAVSALRPHAKVLVVSRDEDFIPEMLSALQA